MLLTILLSAVDHRKTKFGQFAKLLEIFRHLPNVSFRVKNRSELFMQFRPLHLKHC
jgi:hypothetical protein